MKRLDAAKLERLGRLVCAFVHSGTPILPSKDRTRKRIGKRVATLNQSKWGRDGKENPTNSTLRKASNIFGS